MHNIDLLFWRNQYMELKPGDRFKYQRGVGIVLPSDEALLFAHLEGGTTIFLGSVPDGAKKISNKSTCVDISADPQVNNTAHMALLAVAVSHGLAG